MGFFCYIRVLKKNNILLYYIQKVVDNASQEEKMQNKTNKSLILAYEKVLMGKAKHIDNTFFSGSPEKNHSIACEIIRYAIRTYLKSWTPNELAVYLNEDVISRLKLKDAVKHVIFPKEICSDDYFYLAHVAYPNKIKFSKENMIIYTFEQFVKGNRAKMPKNYFLGEDGRERLHACLYYLLETECSFANLKEMYYFFATKQACVFLDKYLLYDTCMEHYDNPVTLLDETLPIEQRSDVYKHMYTLKYYMESGNKVRKEKNKAKKITFDEYITLLDKIEAVSDKMPEDDWYPTMDELEEELSDISDSDVLHILLYLETKHVATTTRKEIQTKIKKMINEHIKE